MENSKIFLLSLTFMSIAAMVLSIIGTITTFRSRRNSTRDLTKKTYSSVDEAVVIIDCMRHGSMIQSVLEFLSNKSSIYNSILHDQFVNEDVFYCENNEFKMKVERNKIVYIHLSIPDITNFDFQAFSNILKALKKSLYFNNVNILHLFYYGPVAIPFFIADNLDHFTLYIYTFTRMNDSQDTYSLLGQIPNKFDQSKGA